MLSEKARSSLLILVAKGDDDALQHLLRDYHDVIHRRIERRIEPRFRRYIDPEDILQNAYITAFRCAGQCEFDGPGGFYKWLEQVALSSLNDARQHLERQKRDVRRNLHPGSGIHAPSTGRSSVVDLFARIHATESTPSNKYARREMQAAVLTAIARLTDDQRNVIRLRFLEDQPAAEVAAALGKSEEAVYAICHRGLKSLRGFVMLRSNP